jgi:hypothetical protein
MHSDLRTAFCLWCMAGLPVIHFGLSDGFKNFNLVFSILHQQMVSPSFLNFHQYELQFSWPFSILTMKTVTLLQSKIILARFTNWCNGIFPILITLQLIMFAWVVCCFDVIKKWNFSSHRFHQFLFIGHVEVQIWSLNNIFMSQIWSATFPMCRESDCTNFGWWPSCTHYTSGIFLLLFDFLPNLKKVEVGKTKTKKVRILCVSCIFGDQLNVKL